MPHKTIIRLSGVARNPANGFPARLLDAHGREAAEVQHVAHPQGRQSLPEGSRRRATLRTLADFEFGQRDGRATRQSLGSPLRRREVDTISHEPKAAAIGVFLEVYGAPRFVPAGQVSLSTTTTIFLPHRRSVGTLICN